MSREHQEQADAIVAAFKDLLEDDVRKAIGEAQFSTLAGMIRVTLSKELKGAVTQIEAVMESLRLRYVNADSKNESTSLSLDSRRAENPGEYV